MNDLAWLFAMTTIYQDVKIEIEKMYLMYEMDYPQGPDVARLRTKDK